MSRNRFVSLAIAAIIIVASIAAGISRADTTAPVLSPSAVYVEVGDGHGSAVHIGGGLFITAAHVAKEAIDGKMVVKVAGLDFEAEVLWINIDYDVALFRTKRLPPVKTSHLACGSSEVVPGTIVEAVGNPLHLRDIHTWGRVSRGLMTLSGHPITAFIADLTIAPGNSGGPVFDRNGRLVGIVSAMAAASTGPMSVSLIPLTYVIPTSVICTLLGRS